MKTQMMKKTLITGMLMITSSTTFAAGLIGSDVGTAQDYVATATGAILSPVPVMSDDAKVRVKFFNSDGFGENYNGTGYDFPSSPNYQGLLLDNIAFKRIPKSQATALASSSQTFSFRSLGSSGTALQTEFRYENPVLSQILISKESVLRVRQTWALDNCDGQSMDTSYSYSDIQNAIARIRQLDFSRYMTCTLKATTAAVCSESAGVSCLGSASLTLKDSGDIEVTGNETRLYQFSDNQGNIDMYHIPSKQAVSYYHPAHGIDSAKQQIVEQATRTFVKTLKAYGNVLIQAADMKPAERIATLTGWINKNKGSLVQNLAVIEQNMNGISALEKLNVVLSVNQGYSYLRTIENSVTPGRSCLDEVVGSGN